MSKLDVRRTSRFVRRMAFFTLMIYAISIIQRKFFHFSMLLVKPQCQHRQGSLSDAKLFHIFVSCFSNFSFRDITCQTIYLELSNSRDSSSLSLYLYILFFLSFFFCVVVKIAHHIFCTDNSITKDLCKLVLYIYDVDKVSLRFYYFQPGFIYVTALGFISIVLMDAKFCAESNGIIYQGDRRSKNATLLENTVFFEYLITVISSRICYLNCLRPENHCVELRIEFRN